MRPPDSTLLVAVALMGCNGGDLSLRGIIEVDSAGVAVVRHSTETINTAPALELSEVFRVGTLDGPDETRFFRLAAAQEHAGEVYTLDVGDHRIRVFSGDGVFLRAFGRQGGGPGEFRRPNWLYVHADTVVVLGQRLNLLDPNGTLLATGPGRIFREDGVLSQLIPTAHGWMGVWQTRESATMSAGRPFREQITVYRVNPLSGELGTTVFSYESAERRLAGEIGFYIAPYYQARPTSTVDRNGNVYYTPGDSYRIDVVDGATGHLSRQIIGDFTAPSVTRAMVAEAVAQERERVLNARPGSETAMYAKVIDQRAALPVPETRSVFGRMHGSPRGWILALRLDLDEDPLRPGNPSTWDLFDAAGHLKGRLVFEGGTRVLSLTSDGLLVTETDELDVQYLVRYRLEMLDTAPK